jgi:hypothetical protein
MSGGPDLESLRLLVLVGERGSLTRAAVDAGMSQPMASKRMSALGGAKMPVPGGPLPGGKQMSVSQRQVRRR